ncbi:Tubulin--tyrosine ligase-like protein 12, partial [Clarias magur]
RYIDGAMTDNLPRSELKNTISISPFSGESDICPKDNSSSFHEVRFTNTSIQVTWGNACRLGQVLFPPEPKIMAELCQNGYKDALRFLENNNLLQAECPKVDQALTWDTPTCCYVTESTRERMLRRLRLLGEDHWWLDKQLVNHLPTNIKKVFCEACKEHETQITGLLPVRVASYMLMPCTLPVESAYSAVQRFVEWIPEVSADARWLVDMAGTVYRQAWKGASSEGEMLQECDRGRSGGPDGENVLVSEFSSKEELIQALICSAFIPVYCGLFPPTFRGVRYVDGGMSNNLPQSEQKNTISISPFSGESDICPKDNSSSLHELRVTNTSIQVTWGNMCRISNVFFPPETKVMAELCQNGYKDALRFLQDNNLLQAECPKVDHALTQDTGHTCCGVTESARERMLRRLRLLGEHHWWLDKQLVDYLPTNIRKVFCEACKEKHGLMAQITGLLPVRVASYMLMPYTLPVESAYSAVQRFVEWIPEVPADTRWLCEMAGSVYRQAWKGASLEGWVFDAGEVFGIMRVQQEDEESDEDVRQTLNPGHEDLFKVIITRESGLQASDPTSVYLVDHAWTYRVESARQQLIEIPGLLVRMASLMGLPFHGEAPDPDILDLVLDNMWTYNQTYQLSQGSAEEKVPVWYIMDEFGSHVQHSSRPSCCMAPLFYAPQQIAYSVLWPLQDLENGDEVTRDYCYGEPDPLVRKCRLLPWFPADLEGVSDETAEPADVYYETILQENQEKLPVEGQACTVPEGKVLKVYTEMKQVLDHLKHPRFQFTEQEDDADVLWMYSHIRDYKKLSKEQPHVLLNQFPCETILTTKDCLASVARRARRGEGHAPLWLPITFNLQTELPQFIRHYLRRQE